MPTNGEGITLSYFFYLDNSKYFFFILGLSTHRKRSLLAGSALYIIGALLFVFCREVGSIEMLFGGRLFVGLGSGVTTSTGPMYLSEIAPLKLRGPAGTLLSLGMVGGILLGQVFSLPEVLGSEHLWQYALSVYAVWVVLCLIPYPYFPESPKYLYIIAGKKDKAVLGKDKEIIRKNQISVLINFLQTVLQN